MLLIGASWSALTTAETLTRGEALQLVPMSSKNKFALIEVTRGTVATDPCALEGPSPGGDNLILAGT